MKPSRIARAKPRLQVALRLCSRCTQRFKTTFLGSRPMCKSCLKQANPRSSKMTSKPARPTKADQARAFLKKAVATWDAKWLSRMLLDDDCRDQMSVPHAWDKAAPTLLHYACQMIFEQCVRTQLFDAPNNVCADARPSNTSAAQVAVLECMPGSQYAWHVATLGP